MKRLTLLLILLLLLLPSWALSATTVTTRSSAGRSLSWGELDGNFMTLRDAIDTSSANLGGSLAALQAAQANGTLGYQTQAAMNSDLAHPANTLALVTNDGTVTNNTYYIKVGASGTGSWQKSALPAGPKFINASSYADFATAVAAQGSSPAIIVVSAAMPVSVNITVPATCMVWILPSGSLSIASGCTVTFNGQFQAGQYTCFSGLGSVSFGFASCDRVVASWMGNDGAAIQKAINSAAGSIKKVYIPSGVWMVSQTIMIPSAAASYGIEITGCKSESSYSYDYSAAFVTTLKAATTLTAIIQNRADFASDISHLVYYTKINNLLLLGDGKVTYGYVNGGADIVEHTTIGGCVTAGIYCGAYTNSSVFRYVTCVGNVGTGALLTGDWSTISVWENCKFRGNGGAGMTIYSAIGSHFKDCVFENNTSAGLLVYRPENTSKMQILDNQFSKCYFEQNNVTTGGGYQISIGGAASSYPTNLVFDMPHIVSGDTGRLGVQISRGTNVSFNTPLLSGVNILATGWFNVGSDTSQISISGLSDITTAPSNVTIDGTGAANIMIYGFKTITSVGAIINNTLKANVVKSQVDAPTTRTLLPVQVAGTVITNHGQSAGALIDLPLAAEGYSFLAVVTDAAAAYWGFRAPQASALIWYNGALVGQIYTSPATPGSAIKFTAVTGSQYYWIAEVVSGSWAGQAN